MIFWTRVKQAINNLWYPRSVTVGKPVETQELANRIARESTVSPANTHAVLRALPNIMAGFMKESDSLRHQHSRHLHPLQQMNATAFFLARLELPPGTPCLPCRI